MGKYVDLQIECQRLWTKKLEVIPAKLGTTHILRKVLSIKPDLVTEQDIQHRVSPRCRDYT